MPSPWVDLLCLHGYIADPRLLRKLSARASPTRRPEPEPNEGPSVLAKRAMVSLRLCLGIGDGALRSQ